ncbi:MAG: hypothetical protein D6699_02635, partial [Aquificota bacterium]
TTHKACSLLDVRFLIVQHELYIKRLELAIQKQKPFDHKECGRHGIENACPFGKKLYSEIIPCLDHLEPHIRDLILQIEEIHCQFHEKAKEVDPTNPDYTALNQAKEISLRLYQKLMSLERTTKTK